MLRNKVSEFAYQTILSEPVDGLIMRKADWDKMFQITFFKNNYSKAWCCYYLKSIKRPVEEHRVQMSELFKQRVDYVDMSAFGVDFK